jgi:hypothetical protein
VIAALVVTGRAVRAQESQHATVALVHELADTAATATIIRTGDRTLILLRERDADAASLATAMASLYRSQAAKSVAPGAKVVITLHGQRRLAALPPNEQRLGDLYLARVRASRVAELEGVGSARLTTIPLAPPRRTLLH